MKKNIYLLITALVFNFFAKAQNSIPNGNFENWTSMTFDIPQYYTQCSNYEAFYKCMCAANEVKSTDSYHGGFAVQLTTQLGNGDTNVAYFTNANINGSPNQWTGGIPYTQIPTGIRAYYKCAIPSPDSGLILVNFKKSGVSIGAFPITVYGTHSSYTLLSYTFPVLPMNPDTVQFAAVSSDFKDNIFVIGSMLKIDSVSFTGVTSQPANFNGDFETWTSVTLNRPNNWYLGGGGPNNAIGVLQTTDKYAGTYAAEMQTYLGDRCNGNNNCHSAAQGGSISTGYYPRHCSGLCNQMGGNPFSKQNDTLCFYYKYVPAGGDSAQVDLNFRHLGNNVWNTGAHLGAAAVYQYKEIIFNTMAPIDTVVVSFQSSLGQDTLLSFIGSDLKVDEVHFHSQPLATGIKTFDAAVGIKIFPNPSNDGNFVVSNVNGYDLVRVYNVYGQEVNASIKKENDYAKIHIDIPGAYFVYINSRGKTTTLKVIVGTE
jgi:hypothetical protein